jgi:hypothetical protein
MDNMTMKVEGNKLIITILDLKANGKKSASGKTKIIAGTGGFTGVDHASGAKVSVNVTVPAE